MRILVALFSLTDSKTAGFIRLISSIMLFFISWRVLGLLRETFPLRLPQRNKSREVRSNDRGGHEKSPKSEIKRPGKAVLSIVMVYLTVCAVAPSC